MRNEAAHADHVRFQERRLRYVQPFALDWSL